MTIGQLGGVYSESGKCPKDVLRVSKYPLNSVWRVSDGLSNPNFIQHILL